MDGEADQLLKDGLAKVAGCGWMLEQNPQLIERDLTGRQAATYTAAVERQRCRSVGQQAKAGLYGVEWREWGSAHRGSDSLLGYKELIDRAAPYQDLASTLTRH